MTIEDVSSEETDSTSTVEESVPQTESTEAVQQEAAPAKQEENVPFHEHPRFKEIIEERRQYKEELAQARGYMEALQKQMEGLKQPQTAKQPEGPKYKQLIDELQTYNPGFAKSYEEILTKLEKAEQQAEQATQLQTRLDNYERQDFQDKANSRLKSLLETNKIVGKTGEKYQREIYALASQEESQGKKLSIQDVERLFTMVHTDHSAYVEELKRDTLKGYVKEKAKDAAPATTTGGAPATTGSKKLPSLDSDEGMEAAVKWFAKERRAARKV